ncbi:hypothetical protein CAEBREN_31440 [Caenorhabditis brenneri]|uniref:Tyrosine-protein phosphatase domain-containing protein n=1 Tax=Caenorhabditis brenneri TaxID=135651 RepID=G0MKN8_CAEBE|nr:hypothetical protein CAEBREN_31440 [Caenorhabditis brenneri]
MNNSQRSKRKKKSKGGDASRRDKKNKTGGMEKSLRKKKGKKNEQSERGKRKGKVSCTASRDTTGTGGTTGSGPDIGLLIDGEGCSKMERKAKAKEKEKEQWSGEETAKKMMASGVFDTATITNAFKEIKNDKPALVSCNLFKNNLPKIRAPDFPIPDEKLIKLTHAPENFICASKITVPDFNQSVVVTQIPDVSVTQNVEDFWRMIFQEKIHSIVIAVMPLECSVTLQQLFPILSSTFANQGKMFLNNKKVESAVGMTAYSLEILPDGCSNSHFTTLYHIHNWKQKRGLDNVGDLVSTIEKVLKANENAAFMSMYGTGRAGTMLALFTSMLQVCKGKEANLKEIVEQLRSERCGLVDNAEQFATVYRAMALWFKNKSQDEEIQKKVNEFAPCVQ